MEDYSSIPGWNSLTRAEREELLRQMGSRLPTPKCQKEQTPQMQTVKKNKQNTITGRPRDLFGWG